MFAKKGTPNSSHCFFFFLARPCPGPMQSPSTGRATTSPCITKSRTAGARPRFACRGDGRPRAGVGFKGENGHREKRSAAEKSPRQHVDVWNLAGRRSRAIFGNMTHTHTGVTCADNHSHAFVEIREPQVAPSTNVLDSLDGRKPGDVFGHVLRGTDTNLPNRLRRHGRNWLSER